MFNQCNCKPGEVCTCPTNHPSDEECHMHEEMLCLADKAWEELMKEKMKAEIQKSCGDKMDKLAKFVTEANNEKWIYLIKGKAKCEEYKNNLRNLMVELCE